MTVSFKSAINYLWIGYSWKSNQYGLTVDTVTAYELVKPNGDIVTVTQDSDSELFFGLKVSAVFVVSLRC